MANVSNVAVFNSKTKQYMNIAPKLGGTDSEVWDMTLYGENVLAATHCALAAARTKDAGGVATTLFVR